MTGCIFEQIVLVVFATQKDIFKILLILVRFMHVAPPSVDQWQSLGLVAWLHLKRNRLAVLVGTR